MTKLSMGLDHSESEVGHLEALNMLAALQTLEIYFLQPDVARLSWRFPHYNLAGMRVDLKLPHLLSFDMYGFSHGKIVLSCPKLAEVTFEATSCLEIQVKDAVLNSLELSSCKDFQFVTTSHEKQLQNLRSLQVLECSKIGGSICDDVSHMRHLQTLMYRDFPATRMPSSFPQGLQTLQLAPSCWTNDVPRGVMELHELRKFHFVPLAYKVTQPWYKAQLAADMSSIDSLKDLRLGHCRYRRTGNEPLERVREN